MRIGGQMRQLRNQGRVAISTFKKAQKSHYFRGHNFPLKDSYGKWTLTTYFLSISQERTNDLKIH